MEIEELFKSNQLLRFKKPGRYLGKEWNVVVKDSRQVVVNVCLAFPDVYEIGMSHLGLRILYHLFNALPFCRAERAFLPWPDLGEFLLQEKLPLFSLESRTPVKEFDVLGFSLQHELSYTSILYFLELAGIPFRASERGEDLPLVIGGGPCVFNPEPVAEFFDAFFLGEAEEAVPEIAQVLKETKGEDRDKILSELSKIKGVYIPSRYRVYYDIQGRVAKIIASESAPLPVKKRVVSDLNAVPFPEKMLVPYVSIVHDRIPLEIARGCGRGCRFCQAGMVYRPIRERSLDSLVELAKKLVKSTGYEEVSLVSLSSTDHSQIRELVFRLARELEPLKVNISLPSLRMDLFSVELAENIAKVRRKGLTFAPEAGTDRMRRVINKGLNEEDIFHTLEKVFRAGWSRVKLYFMIGLPFEREEDVLGIVKLCEGILRLGKKVARKRVELNLSVAAFVPKPHTPFQWVAQEDKRSLREKVQLLEKGLARLRGVSWHWSDLDASFVEALLARGDRKLSRVLEKAYAKGAKMESWSEFFKIDYWYGAMDEEGLDGAFYVNRERSFAEILPWEHLDCGVSKQFMWQELKRAQGEELTLPCFGTENCSRCGVCYGT
ncbi:MAG: hypothetical protein PWP60_18 [Candidatus Atribacteria bacterium]|jgi:radical SAM family uncharacterized protein|nr:hypothetical protein [Candidatus Atribacteria bacterium]